MNPVQMIFGSVTVAVIFSLFVYASSKQAQLRRFKRQHPAAGFVLILLAGYFVIHLFGSIIVFLFGIALPLLCEYIMKNIALIFIYI